MEITRRSFLHAGVAGGIGLAAGLGLYGVGYERHHVAVTRLAIPVANLPPALDGLRIGVLSDFHYSALVSQSDIAAAVDMLMRERPDVVALLGDYVTWSDRRYVPGCIEALAGLAPPCGVFAILGNHDDERQTPRALSRAGFAVLADARTDIRIRGEMLGIAGIRYWTKKRTEVARVVGDTSRAVMLLAHDPRRLAESSALRVPVQLSGHTHGGQIVLPVVGALTRKFPVTEGLATDGATTLFVSRGIGTVIVPIRLNCPPEAAVITLRRLEPLRAEP